MIACYCRVSSRRQKNDSQKAEITRWLRAHGISPSKVTWFEDKETGKTVRRDAFDQMEKAIFDGTIQTVVVWKLDRISRRLKDGINLLADWCERGVRVVSITQQIVTSAVPLEGWWPASCSGWQKSNWSIAESANKQESLWPKIEGFIAAGRKVPPNQIPPGRDSSGSRD